MLFWQKQLEATTNTMIPRIQAMYAVLFPWFQSINVPPLYLQSKPWIKTDTKPFGLFLFYYTYMKLHIYLQITVMLRFSLWKVQRHASQPSHNLFYSHKVKLGKYKIKSVHNQYKKQELA